MARGSGTRAMHVYDELYFSTCFCFCPDEDAGPLGALALEALGSAANIVAAS